MQHACDALATFGGLVCKHLRFEMFPSRVYHFACMFGAGWIGLRATRKGNEVRRCVDDEQLVVYPKPGAPGMLSDEATRIASQVFCLFVSREWLPITADN